MQAAQDAMNRARTREEYLAVAEMFKAIDSEEAAKQAARCVKLADLTKGSKIVMGCYQDKPITWTIVEEHGKQRLLVCDELIAEHGYMDSMFNVTWATSSLRKWLNTEFLKEAFTNTERMSIMYGKVENPKSEKWGTDGGRNTSDRVFILSVEEIEKYLPDQADRAMGKWWWARTPGMNLQSVAAVYADGSIYDYGIRDNYTDGGVRPAMWLLTRV